MFDDTLENVANREELSYTEKQLFKSVCKSILENPEVCDFEIAHLKVTVTEDETFEKGHKITYYMEILDTTKSELNNTVVCFVDCGNSWSEFTKAYS